MTAHRKGSVLNRIGSLLAGAFIGIAVSPAASGQSAGDQTGKSVYQNVCSKCHEGGKDGAPKMNDRDEWRKRAAKGLTTLAEHAVGGYNKMPAHGSQASLSDLEISRAVAYMVSGGFSADPKKPYASPSRISGEELVAARCGQCHREGKDGAPRIGVVADWQPRLKNGVDKLVNSAIRGHNAMQARAGMANLSDTEVRSAVVYMIVQISATTH
ncbi:MAG TPA: c-type cytochrome [Rhodocyclaceae bacterium]|nr:c-type cytochrome [Rhodocyclaceae bacterium]HNH35279.1 c-type cytochrome [Rhodocyclaceae bacterium]